MPWQGGGVLSVDSGMQRCPRCDVEHPRAACRATRVGGQELLLCPACGLVTKAVTRVVREPLLTVYARALRFPLQPDGWIAALGLAIGVWLLSWVPLVGGLLGGGVQLTYLFSVVRASAAGKDDLPQAADFTDWSDVLQPTVRFYLALVVTFAPAVACLETLKGSALFAPGLMLSTLWAVGYLPGATAVASMQEGCLGGANPLPVIELARRIPRDYALTVAVVAALAAPAQLVRMITATVTVPWPIVSTVVKVALAALALQLPIVMARVLGLMLRERADEIGIGD